MRSTPTITVLAGVNGAGKSSIAGEFAETASDFYFNPDTIAYKIRALHPDISHALANGYAWQIGKSLLEKAIEDGRDYRFETTLGGRTIPQLLEKAARSGHLLHLWFCGLASPELHLRRVRARVARGGHDIPEEKIRERWKTSRENLIRLLPHIYHLRVFDNSIEGDLAKGHAPQPVLVLEVQNRLITAPKTPEGFTKTPDWAIPILAAAMRIHRISI